jgi:hypothetical protein
LNYFDFLKNKKDQPCKITNFDLADTIKTRLTCQTPRVPSTLSSQYPGGRGINLIRENVLTSFANLATVSPSAAAEKSFTDQLAYTDSLNTDITVWFKGYLAPGKNSNYEFQFDSITNGDAILLLSTDATSANKVNIL